jgi:2,4-dienoyl-CoA reductase-like NADH-dependent reductase (Old Yellow Enzyme family)
MLFTPGLLGSLSLPNRLVRSATAERMADDSGQPRPQLEAMYRELARGGAGLIITGHMYVHPEGKAHPEMTGIYSDELVPDLARLAEAVHQEGGRVVAQINHGGMQASDPSVSQAVAPSAVMLPHLARPAREMTLDEIQCAIEAFGQAALRAKRAGLDGVQIHGAHGYLISEFLSPFVNRRDDEWGGDTGRRMRFLRAVCQAVRLQVGPTYPVLIKIGLVDSVEGGLMLDEGVQIAAELEGMGVDGVEISTAVAGVRSSSSRTGIKTEEDEAYNLPAARAARKVTRLPIILVGGLRSRSVMEAVLATGDADFIALCRPLLCEPDLPNRLRLGLQEHSACISANRCWAERDGEGIACKCPLDKEKAPHG